VVLLFGRLLRLALPALGHLLSPELLGLAIGGSTLARLSLTLALALGSL
jgi:hypothetical protein